MTDLPLPMSPFWALTIPHWLLTRILGSILLLLVLGGASSAYDAAYPEPPKDNPDMFDGGGTGLAAGIYAVWGIEFEFCCALPLLLLLPGHLRQALAIPDVATRRKRFLRAVVRWHLLLPALAALFVAFNSHDIMLMLSLLGLGGLYAVVAAGVGLLLYTRWLADTR